MLNFNDLIPQFISILFFTFTPLKPNQNYGREQR